VGLCGGFADEKRAKKMRQDDGAEFISGSIKLKSCIDREKFCLMVILL